ncbi:Gfo/Idh/MocA family oxidoreductase [Pedobacter gandavensis]|uniref:Gfo/Idh/MocA family protein n=1 Tax=Pedobacter gandavensis TaxID=2679963 RepID=UPI00292FAA7F|nr:Gfo/Idh/MocA family oxidoreductase [Pedobacter gandavensis]
MNSEPEKPKGINRRDFLKGAAILSSFMIVPRHVLGGVGFIAPSDQIALGFIGTGKQSFGLFNSFRGIDKVRILAACDVHKTKMNLFADEVNQFYAGRNASGSSNSCYRDDDFRTLLNRKDIDAVVIAVPDHWHAPIAVRAAAAGKDIYCEKPLSLSIGEGRAMVNATNKYKRVFQTGSMQRSHEEFRKTALIMRNGCLGDIQSIKVSIGGAPLPYDLPQEEVPAGLDWNFWLGPNEYVHYNNLLNPTLAKPSNWAKWRYYQGLGGGDVTDWGAHMFDIVQWGLDMDKSGPELITPPNGKDQPFLSLTYANGIKVTHENFGKNNAIQIIGSKGKLEVQRGSLVTDPINLKDHVFSESEKKVYVSTNHYLDFINAIQQRGETVASVETGHRTATVGNLANIAYTLKRPLKWDPVKEKFDNDKEANQLTTRSMKKEWRV